MKPRVVAMIAMGAFSCLWAQQSAIKIKALPTGQIPLAHPSWTDTAKCDREGNVYIRFFNDAALGTTRLFEAPIAKLTPAGKLATTFQISQAISDASQARTFAVHNDNVYVPVGRQNGEHYIVGFAPDGSAKTRTKLAFDSFLIILHLAVFDSGAYLVVGTTDARGQVPFTAVFDGEGRLIRKINEPEDELSVQMAQAGDRSYTYPSGNANKYVMLADAVTGSDGNVYLLHGGSPIIYVISATGELVRKIQVNSGELRANSIKSHDGRLAVGFSWLNDVPESSIRVIDLEGNVVANYKIEETSEDSDPILACYDSDGFVLVPRQGSANLHLVKAKLH